MNLDLEVFKQVTGTLQRQLQEIFHQNPVGGGLRNGEIEWQIGLRSPGSSDIDQVILVSIDQPSDQLLHVEAGARGRDRQGTWRYAPMGSTILRNTWSGVDGEAAEGELREFLKAVKRRWDAGILDLGRDTDHDPPDETYPRERRDGRA